MWQEQCTQTLIGKHPVHGSDGGGTATSRGFRGAEPGQIKGAEHNVRGFSPLKISKRTKIWSTNDKKQDRKSRAKKMTE